MSKDERIFKQATWYSPDGKTLQPLIFEQSVSGRIGHVLPDIDKEIEAEVGDVLQFIPESLKRSQPPDLPEVSEVEVVRHFTRLSQMNYGVDLGFYPLGSCTMKYNPKINELVASLEKFTQIHPYQDESTVQGALEVMYRLEKYLAEIAGMNRVTLQPAAGAHGELAGIAIIHAYHASNAELGKRREIIVPDSAHGTNPATAGMYGFKVIVIPSNNRGCVDLDALNSVVSESTAGLMLTNPNTLGIFEEDIVEIAKAIHDVGGLLYYDGANLNAVLNKARPGDMGFDVVHFNLHKTFSTPHGCGGPGAGPVGVKERLENFLPVPTVEYDTNNDRYWLNYDRPSSIGKVKSFYGNFNVLLKAFTYILTMGTPGLTEASESAVLAANYIMRKLMNVKGYDLKYEPTKPRKHEAVLSARPLYDDTHISAVEVAKRLLDHGFHAPTIFFPLIVDNALMIEPNETEPKETMDRFIDIMKKIAQEAYDKTDFVLNTPYNTAIGRIDEVKAAKNPILSWKMYHTQKQM